MSDEEAMKLLKPCPRCRNKTPMLHSFGDKFIVYCGRYECNLEFAYIALTRDECIETWNNSLERFLEERIGGRP